MNAPPNASPAQAFSERYGRLRYMQVAAAREEGRAADENALQCIWYDGAYSNENLATADGAPVAVLSPGWWNKAEGPDFLGAQIRIGGRVFTGDVEIHLEHGGWTQHGHDRDPRYNNVILHVVLATEAPREPARTQAGKAVSTLLIGRYLRGGLADVAAKLGIGAAEYPYDSLSAHGACSGIASLYGSERLVPLLALAGEWRMLAKSRALIERSERTGFEQAVYEAMMTACGYSRFKFPFGHVARQLPYGRIVQLAKQDVHLAEAALLHIAGLLPDALDQPCPHHARLIALRDEHLPGMRPLGVPWHRLGVRPVNYPERRLAGMAGFLAKTAKLGGLTKALALIWAEDMPPKTRRTRFEDLFPGRMGFWSQRCTWLGKPLAHATLPIGAPRMLGIMGNVFVPAALAQARQKRDRQWEERILSFFEALPAETENAVVKIMAPRVFGGAKRPAMSFRLQQGLLQMHTDWCEPNPSCRNCPVVGAIAADETAPNDE